MFYYFWKFEMAAGWLPKIEMAAGWLRGRFSCLSTEKYRGRVVFMPFT